MMLYANTILKKEAVETVICAQCVYIMEESLHGSTNSCSLLRRNPTFARSNFSYSF